MNSPKSLHLAVDIGNTNIVMGMFSDNVLQNTWRINTSKKVTVDEVVMTLKGLLGEKCRQAGTISRIAVACVVPSIRYQWTKALSNYCLVKPECVEPAKCRSFRIDSKYPEHFGADRLCNILACQALDYQEAIIVDFGTATTFDVYSQKTYWGGIICPGIHSSMGALAKEASKISEIELFWNSTVIGKSTDDALRNGILFGTLGQIEYITGRILREVQMKEPAIIATGGIAPLIGKHEPGIHRIEEHLTLIGLNHFLSL